METQTSNVPALPGLRPGDAFAIKEQPYLLNNWKQLLAIADEDDYLNARIRYARVFNGVATLAAEQVMIRTPIKLPNGFYELNRENHFVFSEACDDDVRCQISREMRVTENIDRQYIHELLNWVNWCRQIHKPEKGLTATIVVDEKGFWYQPNIDVHYRIPSHANPNVAVDLPITKEPILLNAFHLKLALVQALRYDTVVIGYQWNPDSLAPLFIGRSWAECSLVLPKPPVIKNPRAHG